MKNTPVLPLPLWRQFKVCVIASNEGVVDKDNKKKGLEGVEADTKLTTIKHVGRIKSNTRKDDKR